MFKLRPSLVIYLFLWSVTAIGCTQAPPAVPTATATSAPTATPTPMATPTLTPTPGPLTSSQIADKITPSLAFIHTPTQIGIGFLVAGPYLVTNAHLIWPFETVNVTLSDGTELFELPVLNVDFMANLAVIGPIETEIPPLVLVNGENLPVGSDLFLLSYFNFSDLSQPSVSRGQFSGTMEWQGITFLQNEAGQAGGRNGGILVTNMGDVIGVAGFPSGESGVKMIASATDIELRVQSLIAGEDVAGLGEWRLPQEGERKNSTVILDHEWDQTVYVFHQPPETSLELELNGDGDGGFALWDVSGVALLTADEPENSTQQGTAMTELDAPHFLQIYQHTPINGAFHINSSHPFVLFTDVDDNLSLSVGRTRQASLQFPGDFDYFNIFLEAGTIMNVQVESAMVDPYLRIVPQGFPAPEMLAADDNTAGGMFGTAAELTYYAPSTGNYFILVGDADTENVGGYIVKVDSVYSGAPTPVSPPPTPTPIISNFGEMAVFEDPDYPFTLQYPADWLDVSFFLEGGCEQLAACFGNIEGFFLFIAIEDLNNIGAGNMSLEKYADATIILLEENLVLLSRESFTTQRGLTAEHLVFQSLDGSFRSIRMIYLDQGIAFNATYVISEEAYEEWEPIIEYSFSTLEVH